MLNNYLCKHGADDEMADLTAKDVDALRDCNYPLPQFPRNWHAQSPSGRKN